MAVKYILNRVAAKMGLNPQDPNNRLVLVGYLNEAARELYAQSDMVGSLMEQVFKINGDQTLSLPAYVGKIRAIREFASMQQWHINQMRPRYNQFNWPDMWRNFRLKNKQCLMASVDNQSVGVITVPVIENPPIQVTVSGPTINSYLVNETVILNACTVQTKNVFLDYTAVKKDRVGQYDISLSQVDGKLLTVIPNNQMAAMYQIIDVSACPWLPMNTSVNDNYMEVLYKKTLDWLSDDADEFPAFDCDDVLVNKMMQLWKEENDKTETAAAYDAKATRTLARLHEDQNRETEDMVAFVANTHDTMLKRIGTGLRRRYSLYAGRKY